MTPKIIELKQAPVVLVELSEHESIGRLELKWDSPLMDGGHKVRLLNNRRYIGAVGLAKHFNEDSILGVLSDLTEDQFAECVKSEDFKHYSGKYVHLFVDYLNCENAFESSSDSFYSLLESENVYTENTYEHLKAGMTFAGEYENKWQEAQSRTIDPTQTVVLLRKEGA